MSTKKPTFCRSHRLWDLLSGARMAHHIAPELQRQQTAMLGFFFYLCSLCSESGLPSNHIAPCSVISRVYCATQKSSIQINTTHYDTSKYIFSLKLLTIRKWQCLALRNTQLDIIYFFTGWKAGLVLCSHCFQTSRFWGDLAPSILAYEKRFYPWIPLAQQPAVVENEVGPQQERAVTMDMPTLGFRFLICEVTRLYMTTPQVS